MRPLSATILICLPFSLSPCLRSDVASVPGALRPTGADPVGRRGPVPAALASGREPRLEGLEQVAQSLEGAGLFEPQCDPLEVVGGHPVVGPALGPVLELLERPS